MKQRKCIDCGKDISHRGNRSKRCVECQENYDRIYHQDYHKKWMERTNEYYKRDLKLGSANPFKMPKGAVNKDGKFPKPNGVVTYWEDDNGEYHDKYTIEREQALIDLDDEIEAAEDEPIVKRTRKEIYKEWLEGGE